jgi:predicted deacetylase
VIRREEKLGQYILRLDDASDHMDLEKWICIEKLLDRYEVKPIFGIIPQNGDESLVSKYEKNPAFWDLMHNWIDKGWIPAMHGYEHRYVTKNGGINPVNKRSEFAGLPYEEQAEKIKKGYQILVEHGIAPEIFFAPSHTFDENTLKAIKTETPIRIISDTFAWDVYKNGDFWFIPQQSGSVRDLPFKTVTFCYHPNTMSEKAYEKLEDFLKQNRDSFICISKIRLENRKRNVAEQLLQKIYLSMHR